ncbi:MAG: carboxypeptidase-like regulatory domain-containing protein [Bacteroidales bacterium]|nr:carboxypeptidase-like regulatory domain-containing protein [Bacteroidales bacterium]
MKKYLICTILVFVGIGLQQLRAQEILIQWTGVVRDDLLQPIPFTHIIVKKDFRGTVSDPEGRFTIITYPNDTLLISSMGYKPMRIPVPDISLEDSKHYIKDIIMEPDTIMLGEVTIFPWKTYKEFKDAFMALELPEDDLQRAYHNIAIMQDQIYHAISSRSASPAANFRDVMATRHNRMMTYGHMYPTYSITNPLAWARFFKAIRDGEFKKKDNNRNENRPSVIEEYNNPD